MCKSSFLVKAIAVAPITTEGHCSFSSQFLEKVGKIVPKIKFALKLWATFIKNYGIFPQDFLQFLMMIPYLFSKYCFPEHV